MLSFKNVKKSEQKAISDYGGKEIFFREREILVKKFVQEANHTKDMDELYYLLGVAHGLDLDTQLDIRIEKQLKFIQRIEKETDILMLNYEIRRANGVLKGLEIQNELMNKLERRKIPSLLVCLIENEIALKYIDEISIEKGLFPFRIIDINRIHHSGGIYRNSITDFENIINIIDFSKYEVSINIIGFSHSEEIYDRFPDNQKFIDELFRKRNENEASLNFYNFLYENKNCWSKTFNKFAFNGRFPIDKRKIKVDVDDSFELALNEYLIIN